MNRLQGKDLINIGIFTAIYFIVIFAAASIGFIPIFIPLISVIVPLVGRHPHDAVFTPKFKKVWYADHHRYHRRHLFLSDRLWLDRPARLGTRWHSKRCRAQNRRSIRNSRPLF